MSRNTRDAAAILDVFHGPEPGDLYLAPPPGGSYIDEVSEDPPRVRIGVMTSVGGGVDVDPAVVAATNDVAKLLESLGHHVDDDHPQRVFDDDFMEHAELDYACNMRASIAAIWRAIGRELTAEDVEPYSWTRMERAAHVTATEHILASAWLQRYTSRVVSWWQTHDLLLTPTTGEIPAKLEELVPRDDDPWSADERYRRVRCFARPFNVTGQPAISLPLGWSDEGLPIGVQLVADLGREDLLLRVGAQLERAAPWADRRPPVSA